MTNPTLFGTLITVKHPTPESLIELLKAVDTAVWAYEVNKQSRRKGQVDWKGALDDLVAAWEKYQIKHSDMEVVTSQGS